MNYNFDENLDRKQTYDMKWNKNLIDAQLPAKVPEDFIPMWIADMDLDCAPHIQRAIKERANKPIYGYCAPPREFYEAISWWQKTQHHWDVQESWITPIPSVVAGINIALRTLTKEGDGVILQSPVYDPFFEIIEATGRKMINNPLRIEGNQYCMDFDLLQSQVQDENTKVMILCSPHNPVGRVWKREELEKLADICIANDVVIITDEIHSDIVYGNHKHAPLLGIKEQYADKFIYLNAPSKTFNVPGLKMSYAIIPNKELKAQFDKMQVSMNLDVRNVFGVESVIACYSEESLEWLQELTAYLEENVNFVEQYLKEYLPQIKFIRPEGTFLCWLDFTSLGWDDMTLNYKIAIIGGVVCVPGYWFGQGGEGHLRFNIGTTKANLEKALDKIRAVVNV